MSTEDGNLIPSVERYLSTPIADRAGIIGEVITPTAVDHDEGQTHVGVDAIRKWASDLADQFTLDAKVEETTRDGNQITAVVTYTGNFPGSPAQVTSHITVDGNKISEIGNNS